MGNHFCIASSDKKSTVPQQKSDITPLKFKSKIQLRMGAHTLWKVHSRFVCTLARIGPRMQSVPAKAETISASVCAQVPGWAREQEPCTCDPRPQIPPHSTSQKVQHTATINTVFHIIWLTCLPYFATFIANKKQWYEIYSNIH